MERFTIRDGGLNRVEIPDSCLVRSSVDQGIDGSARSRDSITDKREDQTPAVCPKRPIEVNGRRYIATDVGSRVSSLLLSAESSLSKSGTAEYRRRGLPRR